MFAIYQAQKASLKVIKKIEIVKKMLGLINYIHERSQAILKKELKKLQSMRDKIRKVVKNLVDMACIDFEAIYLVKDADNACNII